MADNFSCWLGAAGWGLQVQAVAAARRRLPRRAQTRRRSRRPRGAGGSGGEQRDSARYRTRIEIQSRNRCRTPASPPITPARPVRANVGRPCSTWDDSHGRNASHRCWLRRLTNSCLRPPKCTRNVGHDCLSTVSLVAIFSASKISQYSLHQRHTQSFFFGAFFSNLILYPRRSRV